MLRVRVATTSDLQTIVGLIDEAAAWLRLKETDQWSKPWPTEAKRNGRIRRGLKAQRTWIVEDDGVPVATITCRPDANPELWTKSEQGDLAVYVSRLIVRRSHAGQALGSELLNWAGLWAAAQYGARWIRIDVWSTNFLLHDYYEKRGFKFIRLRDDVEYPSAALFQKPTSEISESELLRLPEVPVLRLPASLERGLTDRPREPGPVRRLAGMAARHTVVARMVVAMPRLASIYWRRGSGKRY